MTRKRQPKRRQIAKPNVDEGAMESSVYAMLATGAVMAVVTGSWLPVIGAAAAVCMAAWYVRNGSGNELK
jgi:hypothetical protein